jgi:hypothetical protein
MDCDHGRPSGGQQAVRVNVPSCRLWRSHATVIFKSISGLILYACNATYVGVVCAYGSHPTAALHFSLRAVGIDELFRPRMHQLLDLR